MTTISVFLILKLMIYFISEVFGMMPNLIQSHGNWTQQRDQVEWERG